MHQYKETIKAPLPIILKKYFFFYAIPCILLLPIAVKEVIKLVPHMPHYSGGLIHMYIRCYTSPFIVFAILVLLFLALVAYSNSVVKIVIKNERLFLPIKTGVYNGGQVVTIIPLQDIVSFKIQKHNLVNAAKYEQDQTALKKFKIPCYKGYQGDWVIVTFSSPKKVIPRLLASLGGGTSSYDSEQIRIKFPSEKFEEMKLVISGNSSDLT